MNKKLSFGLATLITLTPALLFAATTKDLNDLIAKITGYLNSILMLLMSLAVVFFVWYVIQYYIKPNDERAAAGQYVMYSLIGFFVILSFWGLVNILRTTFNLGDNYAPSSSDLRNLFPGGGVNSPSPSTPCGPYNGCK